MMKAQKRNLLARPGQIALPVISVAFLLCTWAVLGEDLPTRTPAELARLSDLIVTGRLGADSSIHITGVIKGKIADAIGAST